MPVSDNAANFKNLVGTLKANQMVNALSLWVHTDLAHADRQEFLSYLCETQPLDIIQQFIPHDQLQDQDYSRAFMTAASREKGEVLMALLPFVDPSYKDYNLFRVACSSGFNDFVSQHVGSIPTGTLSGADLTSLLIQQKKETVAILMPYCEFDLNKVAQNLDILDYPHEASWMRNEIAHQKAQLNKEDLDRQTPVPKMPLSSPRF